MSVRRTINDQQQVLSFAEAAVEIVEHLRKGMTGRTGYQLIALTNGTTTIVYGIDLLEPHLAARLAAMIGLLNCDVASRVESLFRAMFRRELELWEARSLTAGAWVMRADFDANVAARLLALLAGQIISLDQVHQIGHRIVWEASVSEMRRWDHPNEPSFNEAVKLLQSV